MPTKTKEELIEEARARGVDFRVRWPKEDIQAAIEKADGGESPQGLADPAEVIEQAGPAEPKDHETGIKKVTAGYRNVSGGRWAVARTVLKPGGTYKLNGHESERDIRKAERAVSMGRLERV